MPAMALRLKSAFGALSVAGTAVALALPALVVLLLELGCVALIELVAEEAPLVVTVAELSIDAETDDTTSLEVAEDATGVLEEGAAVIVSSVVAGGVETLVSVGIGTGGLLVVESDVVSDKLAVNDVLSTVGVVASELESSVVMSLTVAVMVSAMLGNAPYTPSQIVYPLLLSMSTPRQFEITHCKDPSPIVNPEVVLVVQRKPRSAVEAQVCL